MNLFKMGAQYHRGTQYQYRRAHFEKVHCLKFIKFQDEVICCSAAGLIPAAADPCCG